MAVITGKPENLPTTDTLKSVPDPENHALQIPAIDATFVKFTGTSGELLDNPPERRDKRTYIVKAVCKGYDIRDRADGEERVVAVMEITSCYERGRVPIVDENQGSLFAVADPDDADGDEDEEPGADDEPEDEDIEDGVDRPGFSDAEQ